MAKQSPVATTATAALRLLWERGYFRSWRTKGAVEAEFARGGYHFSGPELGMALMRAPQLTRKGNKGSYQYVQKYPFFRDAGIAAKSKKKSRPK